MMEEVIRQFVTQHPIAVALGLLAVVLIGIYIARVR